MSCRSCGADVALWFAVMLCDDCIDARTPEKPCHVCGKMDKYHPRMTRLYDGGWTNDDGTVKEPRYFCAEHSEAA